MKVWAISCAMMIFVFPSISTAMGITDESLVLHLTFDEGKGNTVADDSIHQNNGSIMGNPKWVNGKFGSALSFDGAGDTVEIKHADILNTTTAVTMEMWVKTPGGAEVKQAGIEKGIWAVGEYSLYPVYEGGTVVQFYDLPPACGDAGIKGRGIMDDKWHYLAGVWDGKTIYLYIDGELEKSGACAGSLGTTKQGLYIGSRVGNERFLTGTVDEVRMYDRALTQAEIQKDMETFGKYAVSPSGKLAVCWGEVKQK
jgi:hypothetical protein